MITANELRIGNLLQDEDGVFPITKNFFILLESNLETCKTIPLNEDWLLKLGFVKVIDRINETYKIDFGAYYFQIILQNDGKSYNVRLSNHALNEKPDVVGLGILHNVHQLQNLYYALTGKELTIKKQ